MSAGQAKFAFVALLAVQGLLWSQSRYARVQGDGPPTHGLFRRAWLESPSEIAAYAECAPLKHKPLEQCAHVQSSCPVPDTFLNIPYTQSYFCTAPSARPLAFGALLLWLVFLFSTLGISSADFFCPNLGTLAATLGLDESVAGVTFLAFGNGSPDMFATFSAMRAHSASLALGELLGAAAFIVSCVVGSLCLIKPFRAERYQYLRDVGFFIAAVALLVAVLWDGRLMLWETMSLVALYVCYVLVVVVGTWLRNRWARKRSQQALIRSEYAEDEVPSFSYHDQEPYRDEEESTATPSLLSALPSTRTRALSSPPPHSPPTRLSLPPRPHSHAPTPPRSGSSTPGRPHSMAPFSLLGALEFRTFVESLQPHAAGASLSAFDTPVSPYAGAHYFRRAASSRSRSHARSRSSSYASGEGERGERDPWDAALSVLGRGNDGVVVETPAPLSPVTMSVPDPDPPSAVEDGVRWDASLGSSGHGSIPRISHTPATPRLGASAPPGLPSSPDIDSLDKEPKTKWQHVLHAVRRTAEILFPTLRGFGAKSFATQLVSVFAAPAVLLLTLTLPVVVTPLDDGCRAPEKRLSIAARRESLGTVPEGTLVEWDAFEEEGVERALIAEEEVQNEMHDHLRFSKWLVAAQCVFGPLFSVSVVFDGNPQEPWLVLAALIAGLAAAILVAVFATDGTQPAGRLARTSAGFLVAVVWIMAIADEVVNVLQAFGYLFGLSHALIGLTIFAAGNSLADLVANISVAAFAPMMGFSACFGGPMLNMLLGVGVSGSWIISQTGKPYELEFSTTLVISSMSLLAVLLVSAVVVPWNGYHLTKRWGAFLIGFYVVIMTVNVIVELRTRH